MDLMTGTTSLEQLKNKYGDFILPGMEITIDGSTRLAASKDINIHHAAVDLTCGFEASGCEFLIGSCYEAGKDDFEQIADKFNLGAKIQVAMGYETMESLFTGYINRISHEFGAREEPVIRIRCMDAKGLMMKNRRLEAFKEKKADAVVKKLLSDQPVSYYLSGKEVDSCDENTDSLRSSMKTDYDIVVELARKTGYEFFIIQGKAYFRPEEKNTSPIMTLSPECKVEECIASISSEALVQTVDIRSINAENGTMISGKAKLSGNFGAKAVRLYQNTTQVFYEAGVSSVSEASRRADVRMEAMKARFGSLQLTCIGIPELVPGRFLNLEKFSGLTDDKYYITSVTHSFTREQFYTTVKGRRKKMK